MKFLISFFLIFSILGNIKAQCFEIESILVDGCDGSNEGMNEMVRFQVGNSPLSVNTLTVNWPNNSWLGVCQSASTASSVASINATILGCGFLKEPVGGVLPANSKVLLVTSTAFNPMAQSFVNLSDTLIIIFQCAGNTAGHFANYTAATSPSPLRTLSMSFSGTCSDAVTYNRNNLTKQNGTVGGQDGGAVEFDPAGNPTYVNRGCSAPVTPFSVKIGPSQIICSSSFAALTATLSGAGNNSLTWSGGTGMFSSTTAPNTTYTPGAGETGTVNIFCTVTKPCGTQTLVAKDTLVLTVYEIPVPVISSSSPTFCPGQSTTLSYSLTNSNATGVVTNTWLPSGSNASGITVNSTNIYTVQVSNSCGVGTHTISVSSLPNPTVSISANGPTSFCDGGSVILTANSSEGNYLWNTGATTQTISVNTTATAIVTTSNACTSAQFVQNVNVTPIPTVAVTPTIVSICAGGSANLQATANTVVTYTWSTGDNTSIISVNTPGIYTVSASNNCGNSAATSTVVNSGSSPSILINATPSVICSGQTSTLTISGSAGTYSWSTGASGSSIAVTAPGVYTASVTNSCGNGTASITVSSLPIPSVSVTPSSTVLCNGQSVVATANSNVNDYNWTTGAVTNTVLLSSAGTYSVFSSNSCGTANAAITITQQNLSPLNISASSLSICPNQTATLTVIGGNAPYTWSNSSSTGSAVVTGGGFVSVSYNNACGTSTAGITVFVDPISASISANPFAGVKPLVVNFTNNSNAATSYLWDFGNGNTASTQNVGQQTYENTGVYIVSLSVSNGLCTAMDTLMIKVYNEEPGITIPNVFTPNGDSVNDVFRISGYNIVKFNCTIFDRWGLQLFFWDDISKGWDGKTNGKDVPDGNYFYIINAKDIMQKDVKKQGAFLLVR